MPKTYKPVDAPHWVLFKIWDLSESWEQQLRMNDQKTQRENETELELRDLQARYGLQRKMDLVMEMQRRGFSPFGPDFDQTRKVFESKCHWVYEKLKEITEGAIGVATPGILGAMDKINRIVAGVPRKTEMEVLRNQLRGAEQRIKELELELGKRGVQA